MTDEPYECDCPDYNGNATQPMIEKYAYDCLSDLAKQFQKQNEELRVSTTRLFNQLALEKEIHRNCAIEQLRLGAENTRFRKALENIAQETGTPYARIASEALKNLDSIMDDKK